MILSEEYLTRLLAAALESIDMPEGGGVLLEGSIAEGFGNDQSDIDFLVIAPGDHEFLTMPTLIFADGRRIEVRIRSMAQIRSQVDRLRALARSGPGRDPATFEDLLNRCQRLSHGVAFRGNDIVRSAQALMPSSEIEAMVSEWYRGRARRCGRYAMALAVLELPDRAVDWIRSGLTFAAKSWAAGHGESYLGIKWTADQFARAVPPEDLARRFTDLAGPCPSARAPADGYLSSAVHLLGDLGVDGVPWESERVRLTRSRTVTTWQLGNRVHVVRDRSQVYALDPVAATVWRSLMFGVPVVHALRQCRVPLKTAGEMVARFHRLGLIGLEWRGGGAIRVGSAQVPPASANRPVLGMDGLVFADPDDEIKLAPLPAERFASAGIAHVWANLEIENAREDLAGAIKCGQAEVAAAAGHRMLRYTCLLLLNAYGHYPHPAVEEAVSLTLGLPDLPAPVLAGITELEAAYRYQPERAHRESATMDGPLAQLVLLVREHIQGDRFPLTFDSADGWRQTLEIGYDWVRLGAYLDSDFPIDEVRDLVTSGGAQPSHRPSLPVDPLPEGERE